MIAQLAVQTTPKKLKVDAAKCIKLTNMLAEAPSTLVPATTNNPSQLQEAVAASISCEWVQEEGQQSQQQSEE